MSQDANSPSTHLCSLCGAPLVPGSPCDYDRPQDTSPALGDYEAMHLGLMTHAEHLLVVARWAMHNESIHSPAVLRRFRPVVDEAWGRPQKLFPLRA